jgi:hypothetical protein
LIDAAERADAQMMGVGRQQCRRRRTGDGDLWDCYLKTLDRRILAGPLRKRQLAREVENSLGAIAPAVNASESP